MDNQTAAVPEPAAVTMPGTQKAASPPPSAEEVLSHPTPLDREKMIPKSQHDAKIWEERNAREKVEEELIRLRGEIARISDTFRTVEAENQALRSGARLPGRGAESLEQYLAANFPDDFPALIRQKVSEALNQHQHQQTQAYQEQQARARAESVWAALKLEHPDAEYLNEHDPRLATFWSERGITADQMKKLFEATDEAEKRRNVDYLSGCLANFKLRYGILSAPSGAHGVPAASLADLPRPVASGSSAPSTTQTPERIYTIEEYSRISDPRVMMNHAPLLEEYSRAFKEGRVRGYQ